MRRRLFRVVLLSLLSIAAGCVVIAGAFVWRLSQGPVSIDFLAGRVQDGINKHLEGMSVSIGGLVIERKPGSGAPSFHLRAVELRDADGGVIARAPRAAVKVDEAALMSGAIVPTGIELIGPRILVKRTAQGQVQLGFGAAAPDESDANAPDGFAPTPNSSKRDREVPPDPTIAPETPGATVLEALAGRRKPQGGQTGGIGGIEEIRVSDASISLYDEANDSYWSAPDADLAFKRMPFGFTVAANATIASGGEPWRTELTVTYRTETRSFAIGARISDFVPADISDEIFALSQLAQVQLPLSGTAEVEIGEDGVLKKASAEFSAAAGRVGLADFLSEPIIVDEGALRFDYDPATGGVAIRDSSILVGGSRAELTGRIDPIRTSAGSLKALKLLLNARNVSLDTTGTLKDPLAIDQIDFAGTAAVDQARLDIDDLVVLSGAAGVRIRGNITGGAKSPGINLAGRIQNLPAAILKKLWPPMVAPNTRKWVGLNVSEGTIPAGEFRVMLAPDQLAAAEAADLLPNATIDAKFSMTGVTTGYFGGLPAIRDASGDARLQGDTFDIAMNAAHIDLPSGKKLSIFRGNMQVTALLAKYTPAVFTFDAAASVQAALEFMDLQPLALLRNSDLDVDRLGGTAKVELTLSLPLSKEVPRDSVNVSATAKIADASLKNAVDGIDLTAGSLDLDVGDGFIRASGPVKLNGIPAQLAWSRGTAKDSGQTVTLEADLDGDERKKIGVDIDDYVRGPIKVKATVAEFRGEPKQVGVEADLSRAELHLDAIDWVRPAQRKTTAKFDYLPGDGPGGVIKSLVVAGNGVSIKGDIRLAKGGGLAEADLPTVTLSDENRFGVRLKRSDAAMSVSIAGLSFDARPLIKSMFAPSKGNAIDRDDGSEPLLLIDANVERIHAHRGEIITGVRGSLSTRGGSVQSAQVGGSFASGQQISFRIAPVAGGRELKVTGRDGGAMLRAANLYSKVAGGDLDFSALLGAGGTIRNGQLVLRDFEVRNEAALAELDRKGKPKKSGPRKGGIAFRRLTLPFSADARFVRIGDALARGSDICASAQGVIRKSDGAIDIDGTIIPACGINELPGEIPILGDLLVPDGLFGVTYSLGGTFNKPDFQVNPVSAIAPGFLRKFFEYGSSAPVKNKARTN